MIVTATDARNRFGALCLQAKEEPVIVEKAGRPDTVLLSWADYQRLTAERDAGQRQADFNQRYAGWLAEQNARFDTQGVWNDDLRVW